MSSSAVECEKGATELCGSCLSIMNAVKTRKAFKKLCSDVPRVSSVELSHSACFCVTAPLSTSSIFWAVVIWLGSHEEYTSICMLQNISPVTTAAAYQKTIGWQDPLPGVRRTAEKACGVVHGAVAMLTHAPRQLRTIAPRYRAEAISPQRENDPGWRSAGASRDYMPGV